MYLSAKTECCSGSVHSNVSTTDYGYFFSCNNRSVVAVVKSFHQIASCQILISRKDTVCCLTRNTHEFRKSGARADEYCLKPFFFNEHIDRCRFTDYHVSLELHAEFFHLFDLFCNDFLLWKTKLRNTVNKYTAKFMERFEYCHVIPHLCKITCTGQTRRTRADDSNLVPILLFCSYRLNIMLQSVIRNKSLQFTNRNRLSFDTTDTFSLTLCLLRTDTSTDCRKRGRQTDGLICALEISFFYLFDECRNIDRYRTSLNTLCILTINAACRFFHCFFCIISKTYFFKVCRSFFRILFPNRYFL